MTTIDLGMQRAAERVVASVLTEPGDIEINVGRATVRLKVANTGDRPHERNLRRVDGKRRSEQRDYVGVVLLVGGDYVDEDLNLVLESIGEQRPDGAIDDSGLEDLGVVRAAFTLDEAAWNLAGGVHLLFELDLQGEEVDTFARLIGSG